MRRPPRVGCRWRGECRPPEVWPMSGPGLGHQGPLAARGSICHQRRATTGPGLLCVHRVLNGKAHPAPEAELPDPDIQPDVEPIGPCSYRRQAPLYSGSSLPRRRPIKRHSDFSILNLPFHARHSPVHPNWWTGLCFEDNQSFIAAPRSLCPAPCWQSDVVTISREERLRSRSAKSGGHSNTPLWRGLSANTWARMLPLSLVEASITAPKEKHILFPVPPIAGRQVQGPFPGQAGHPVFPSLVQGKAGADTLGRQASPSRSAMPFSFWKRAEIVTVSSDGSGNGSYSSTVTGPGLPTGGCLHLFTSSRQQAHQQSSGQLHPHFQIAQR